MAAITNPTILYQSSGSGVRSVLLGFQKVTAGDTFDATTLATPFNVVTTALFVAKSNRTATSTLATGTPGTTITVAGTGIANDTGELYLVGE